MTPTGWLVVAIWTIAFIGFLLWLVCQPRYCHVRYIDDSDVEYIKGL